MCKGMFVLFVTLILASSAGAANVYVNAAATGSNSGTDWANAYTSLQSAMTAAVSGDVVHVAEGIYSPGALKADSFQPASGVTMLGGYSKDYPGVLPRDPKTYRTILDGDVNGDDIIYDYINNPDLDETTLDTAALTGERSDNNSYLIYVVSKTNITIDGFVFMNGTNINTGYTGGCGVHIRSCSAGAITVKNCEFYRGYSHGNGGGGVYVYNSESTVVTISDCLFEDNGSYDSRASALVVCGRDKVTGPNVTVTRCTFRNNWNCDYGEGIVSADFRWTLTLNDCLFIENGRSGNSILWARSRNDGTCTLNVNRCAFIGNRVIASGAINLQMTNTTGGYHTTSIQNSLIVNNESGDPTYYDPGAGVAGIVLRSENATYPFTVTIQNCTIADNKDTVGGYPAIRLQPATTPVINPTSLTVKNCILWGNKGYAGSPSIDGWDSSQPGALNVNYNCISTTDPNDYLPAGSVGNFMADPQFVNPGIGDYHLQSTSPCIDKGDPASSYANEPKWLNGCRVNMGAYGNTNEAATTTTCVALTADTNGDCRVNNADLLTLRGQWLKPCP